MLKILTDIFYENGKISLGRLMLISYFIFLMILLIISFNTGKSISNTFLSVFEDLLYYVFGVKLVGIVRASSNYIQTKLQSKKEPTSPKDFNNTNVANSNNDDIVG